MRLKKLISDETNESTVQIVDNSYILLETEEFVCSAVLSEKFFFYNRVDYIRFRKYLKYLCAEFWEDLDAENRHICIDNYVKPESLSWEATGYTDEQLRLYWWGMVLLEKKCRIDRINECISKLTWLLTGEESMQVYNDCKQMIEDWKQCEYPELYFFVNSLAGTVLTFDYSTTGFASKSYYNVERFNLVNSILFND